MNMTPLLGFMPDADPTTPGAVIECDNMLPSVRGMAQCPGEVSEALFPAFASTVRGAFVGEKLDKVRRVFAGSSGGLYELDGAGWNDRSRALGYTLGATDLWSFAQFGNSTLAATPSAVIQRSTATGFADIATSPKALCITSAAGFVVAFNTIDGTYGTTPDRWWCCAQYDETDWTPALATQAATGQLVDKPGPILAAAALGDQIVAYKESGLWVGQYVGSPEVWKWNHYPGTVGAVGPKAVANAEYAHFFASRDDIFVFDGTRPVSIADGKVREYFRDNLSATYAYKVTVHFDKATNLVWVMYPSKASTGSIDYALVYHVGSKRWGRFFFSADVESVVQYRSYGSAPETGRFAYFNNTRYMFSFTSTTTASNQGALMFNQFGADDYMTGLKSCRVAFTENAGQTYADAYIQQYRHSTPTLSISGRNFGNGKYDLRQKARWHRVRLICPPVIGGGISEITAYGFEAQQEGKR